MSADQHLQQRSILKSGKAPDNFGNPVLGRKTAGIVRAYGESRNVIGIALNRHPQLSDSQLFEAIDVALASSYEYGKFARLHHQRDKLFNEGGGIAVFGTARVTDRQNEHPFRREVFEQARKLGQLIVKTKLPIDTNGTLGEAGLAVISGAGPGVMRASCMGANPTAASDAKVWGNAVYIPTEKRNPFVPEGRFTMFERFPFRKLALMDCMTRAVVVLPGGYGTIEEFMEVLSLIEGDTLPEKPVVFLMPEFWRPAFQALRECGLVSADSLKRISLAESPEEALRFIKDYYDNPENIKRRDFKPFRFLDDYAGKEVSVLPMYSQSNGTASIECTSKRIGNLAEYLVDSLSERFEQAGIAEDADDAVYYGTLKFFADRFMVECALREYGVNSFVLQLGATYKDEFRDLREGLLARGHVAAGRISNAILRENGWNSGIEIHLPNNQRLQLPTKYRLTAFDVATQYAEGIVVSEGGLSTHHRLGELLCWYQTGKMQSKVGLVALDRNESSVTKRLFRALDTLLLQHGFISGGDNKILQFGQSVDEVIDRLQLVRS